MRLMMTKYQSTKVLVVLKSSREEAKISNGKQVARTDELWYFVKWMKVKAKPHTHPPSAYRDSKVVTAWIALRLSKLGFMSIALFCDQDFHLLCVSFVAHEDTVKQSHQI